MVRGRGSVAAEPAAPADPVAPTDQPALPGPTARLRDVSTVGAPAADSPILAFLRRLYVRHLANPDGRVATYIPELARADPNAFAICVATADGTIYEVGDTRTPFTIQSISKPLTYAAVLDLHGEAAIRSRIGVEPTGEAFNAITLAPGAGTPFNPMVNAGAIAAVGMVPGDAAATIGMPSRIEHLLEAYGRFVGHPLTIDEATYRSESETGHRNRAIAHLLRSTGALDADPDPVVDAYFRQCSVAVDTRDLALIAATLAAGGRNPVTGERAASEATVRSVLSVMATCGMYDGAGQWLFEVGLPAKSGVSGGIIAVLPGRLGIGVWSPPLDDRGNSVRGVAVCTELANELDLHLVRGAGRASPVRTRTTVAATPSKRSRPPLERGRLVEAAGRSMVLELEGDIAFVEAEAITREALAGRPVDAAEGGLDVVVVDVRRVTRIDPAIADVLADLVAAIAARGAGLAWSGVNRHDTSLDAIDERVRALGLAAPRRFRDLDRGIEWAEEIVLGRGSAADGDAVSDVRSVRLADHPAMRGLDDGAIARLTGVMERRHWTPGEALVRRGEPASELFLVTAGRLSVSIPIGDGEDRRLATLEAGGLVGELAFLGRERRTADVRADTDVEAWILDVDAFERIAGEDPAVTTAFLETLLRIVAGIARRMTDEVSLLAS